jgi:hypothetical protein
LRNVVNDCVELQYIIELAADNMIDGPRKPGTLCTAERLSLLLERRQRWRDLDWAKRVTVPIPGQCQAYELVGGSFAKAMGRNGESNQLNTTSLPTRSKPASTILRDDLGVTTRDFAIDPSQDLLALLEMVEFDDMWVLNSPRNSTYLTCWPKLL